MNDDDRRFTEQEVALILKHASELDQARGSAPARGLSRADLVEIARETGISVESMQEAVARVAAGTSPGGSRGWAPRTQRAVRAVGGALDREAQARVMAVVDQRAAETGTVTEALGSTRWTGRGRFHSLQVTLTPRAEETSIQVAERATGALARVSHLVPGVMGLMLASAVQGGLQLEAAGAVALIVAGVGSGLAAGRAVWNRLARRRARRVEALAALLSEAAREAEEDAS